ncbi:MAG TPA: hypothetical protein VLW50_19625 [Streptosporangiaceae bacterium]|nr:hypothetical protein [Streptosporangiaceae bacterium]
MPEHPADPFASRARTAYGDPPADPVLLAEPARHKRAPGSR